MFRECIEQVLDGQDLSMDQAKAIMDEIADGGLAPEELAMFLIAMRTKKEKADEIAGIVISAREHAISLPLVSEYDSLCDIVGTGGDKSNTINISTLSAIIAAGAGAKVAKHGNRAVSSLCGSADVLEALGVNITAKKETVANMIDKAGMGFMFAPLYHPAMKHVAPMRKILKVRTFFNILGPLINPASVPHILLGVYSKDLMELMSDILIHLKISHAMVLCSHDSTDEISVAAKTEIIEIQNSRKNQYSLDPQDFCFDYNLEEQVNNQIKGGGANENAKKILQVLQKQETGIARDTALLNAAALLKVSHICPSIKEGLDLAEASLESGKAFSCLEQMRGISNSESS